MDNVDPFDAAIAAALRGKLAEKNLTRTLIAERTGYPLGTLERYFKGTRSISASKLVIVADAMGVEVGELIQTAKNIFEAATQHDRIKTPSDNDSE